MSPLAAEIAHKVKINASTKINWLDYNLQHTRIYNTETSTPALDLSSCHRVRKNVSTKIQSTHRLHKIPKVQQIITRYKKNCQLLIFHLIYHKVKTNVSTGSSNCAQPLNSAMQKEWIHGSLYSQSERKSLSEKS